MSRPTIFRHGMCECADRGCPAHKGEAVCLTKYQRTLYRIDQTDRTGTRFCDACADDAMASGLFRGGR